MQSKPVPCPPVQDATGLDMNKLAFGNEEPAGFWK